MNITITGNLKLTGDGHGGLFVPNIDKMTVYLINIVINVPTQIPALFSFFAYEVT